MRKSLFFLIIGIIIILFSECSINSSYVDLTLYLKKIWIVNLSGSFSSFQITNIDNSKLKGLFSKTGALTASSFYFGDIESIEGTIDGKTATCHFDEGVIIMTFQANDKIEATIKYDSPVFSEYNGTFIFKPYNIKDVEGEYNHKLQRFEKQCFSINLNSWGTVDFVTGSINTGTHLLTEAFLTNSDNDILYDFGYIPETVSLHDVSFQDVDGNSLKDLIIIYGDKQNSWSMPLIYIQREDGMFINNPNLDDMAVKSCEETNMSTISAFLKRHFGLIK